MTLDDVVQAKTRLEAQGQTPSGNTVLAQLKAQGVPASKRTVLKHLRTLAGAPRAAAPVPVPVPDPVPPVRLPAAPALERRAPAVPPAPVGRAEVMLADAEARFLEARDALVQAKLTLLATRPLLIEGILRGHLHEHDELHAQALDDVTAAKQLYDEAWQARETARQHLEQVTRQHREVHQKAWVAQHQLQLVQAVAYWAEKLRTATTNGLEAQAKRESGLARYALQQAEAQAPWDHNGTAPDHRSP